MVVTYHIELFRMGADRHNGILVSLLLLVAETINSLKRKKSGQSKDNVVIIFMNSFNAVHALTTLQMKILLIMRTYYNNNKKWN